MKKLFTAIAFIAVLSGKAQKLTGYWYGEANVDISGIHNNYLTELVVQQKGNHIKGYFGYYFKDIYESFLIKGTYNPDTREIIIKNIPIIYYNTNSTVNSIDCITNFYGTLLVSKVKTTLTGYFVRDKKYEYTCPDLRAIYTLYTEGKMEDSIFQGITATKKFWKPQSEEYIGSVAETKKPEKRIPELKQITTAVDSTTDSLKANISSIKAPVRFAAVVKDPVKEDLARISESYKKRKNLVNKELEITSDSIRLSFYDNGIVDGDSISVFLNNKLILAHRELTERAFNLYVKLDSLKEVNEVSMFAENLGKYPPNTALMVVNDGDNRFEVYMSSDFKGNATVKFRRKKNSSVSN